MTQSTRPVGSSAADVLAESFDATCERETLQGRRAWAGEREAGLGLFRRLHRHNTRRRDSGLGRRGPVAAVPEAADHVDHLHQDRTGAHPSMDD
ncbi:hypothetical protein ABT383_00835 [Streptomyces humidus]|uniref:hypothetical protein n=1 Tax=Streptomyces humidus TaxID=52259 RepID=UPI00167EC5D0|nr:hypothetical protein [Streptomyces humidus]